MRAVPPGQETSAIPASALGAAIANLNPAQLSMLREAGVPLEALRVMPPAMAFDILNAVQARRMPPQVRALVPRGWAPPYPFEAVRRAE